MDFLYGVVPAVLLVVGILLAGLSLRRVLSFREQSFSTVRKIVEGISLSFLPVVTLALGFNSAINAIILHHYRVKMPGKLYLVDSHRMRFSCFSPRQERIVWSRPA